MSGFPRDLAVLDPWEASFLERSPGTPCPCTAASVRAGSHRRRLPGASLAALVDTRSQTAGRRDLAQEQLWELSLGRSPGAQRAADLDSSRRARAPSASPWGRWRHSRWGRPPAWPTGRPRPAKPAQPRAADHDRTLHRAQRRWRRQAGASCSNGPSAASKSTASSARKPKAPCAPSRRAAACRSTVSSARSQAPRCAARVRASRRSAANIPTYRAPANRHSRDRRGGREAVVLRRGRNRASPAWLR